MIALIYRKHGRAAAANAKSYNGVRVHILGQLLLGGCFGFSVVAVAIILGSIAKDWRR